MGSINYKVIVISAVCILFVGACTGEPPGQVTAGAPAGRQRPFPAVRAGLPGHADRPAAPRRAGQPNHLYEVGHEHQCHVNFAVASDADLRVVVHEGPLAAAAESHGRAA